jgi:transposase
MSAKRLSIRKVKEVLRLKWECGLSNRQIAKSCSIGRATVAEYLCRARAAGLSWPLPDGLDEAEVDRRLFLPGPCVPAGSRLLPEWSKVHRELKRKGVTLFLLWQEYKQAHPNGYQYSSFCRHYQTWAGSLDLAMRQNHRAGEKLFVDYAGQTVPVVDSITGQVCQAQIFVAVLGASNYTYAEATWTQSLPDWISSHTRAFEFFCGVPELVVPDNLKTGITQACRYEPDLNPSYQEMASHYGCAVIPTRVRKPRDKAKKVSRPSSNRGWTAVRSRSTPRRLLSSVTTTSGDPNTITKKRRTTMLPHPTLDRLQALRFNGMAQAFHSLRQN